MTDNCINYPKERIRLAIIALYFVQGICLASWSSRIADVKTHLQLSDLELGNILFTMGIAQFMTLPFSNLFIAKFGSKAILTVGGIGASLALFLLSMTSNISQLMIYLISFGFFCNFIHIALNTQGVILEKHYGKILMSTFHGVWSIAGLLGAVIGTITIYLGMNISQHLSIISLLTLSLTLLNNKYLYSRKLSQINTETTTRLTIHKPEFLLIKLGFIGFCGLMIEGTIYDWSSIYYKETLNAPHQLITIGYTTFMITLALVRFFIDKVVMKIGHQKAMQGGGILALFGLIITALSPNYIITTGALILVAIGTSCNIPIIYNIVGTKSKTSADLGVLIISIISFTGFLIGPPLIGNISETFGLRYSFGVLTIFALLITITASLIHEIKKNSAE